MVTEMTTKVLHPTETMSQMSNFDQWLKNWAFDNRSFIGEAGMPASEYFEASIQSEADAVGFWIGDERVDFTDDMEYAKQRVDYWYEESKNWQPV